MHPKDANYLKLCIHSKFNEFWTGKQITALKVTGRKSAT
jgi:hypothetical protein